MVFQPHRYSRTQDLFEEFVAELGGVDQLLLLPIYSAGEDELQGVSSDALAARIRGRHKIDVSTIANPQALSEALQQLLIDDDVLVMQGAGDVGKISAALASGELVAAAIKDAAGEMQ